SNQIVSVTNVPTSKPELITSEEIKNHSSEIPLSRFMSVPRNVFCPFLTDENWKIHHQLQQNSYELGEKYRLEQAIRMGSKEARGRLLVDTLPDGDTSEYHPVIDGKNIRRFQINWDGEYLRYLPNELYN